MVLKPGETITFKELTDFLISREIAKFKLPERLEVVESLPVSPAGKILKRALKETITAKLLEEKRLQTANAQ